MLTTVQKEILQSLINLYRQSQCTSVKCENIADLMGRNAGTIRNQMQSLRSLGLVKGVPGPRGGYKPTLDAYQTLNIENDPCEIHVPIKVNSEIVSDISVNKIEFTSIVRPGACEATITVLGDIKQLDLNDEIQVGPTPVNNLTIIGKIIGRDDVDNAVLIKTESIQSIPNIKISQLASTDIVTISPEESVKEICEKLLDNKLKSAPVIEDEKILGFVSYKNIFHCIVDGKTDAIAKDVLDNNVVTAKDSINIITGINLLEENDVPSLILLNSKEKISGIVTFTDLLEQLVLTT